MTAFIINKLEASSCFVLAFLYLITSGFTAKKLRQYHQSAPEWITPKKLLMMSFFMLAITRVLAFSGMTLLQLWNIEYWPNHNKKSKSNHSGTTSDQPFYEKTVFILFDLPDFIILSSYTLLVLIWLDVFLQSRLHWLPAEGYRRWAARCYLLFQLALYGAQLALYGLLLLPDAHQTILQDILYIMLTSINGFVIFGYLTAHFFFSIRFSGFPSISAAATNRLNKVTKIVCYWTWSRIVWALFALTTVAKGWLSDTGLSNQVVSIVLVALFIMTEIMPCVGALNSLLTRNGLQTNLAVPDHGEDDVDSRGWLFDDEERQRPLLHASNKQRQNDPSSEDDEINNAEVTI